MGPLGECHVGDVIRQFANWPLGNKVSGILPISRPVRIRVRQIRIACMLINHRIPNCMQVASTTLRWQGEGVSAEVAFWVVVVEAGGDMQWLMHIPSIMNQKPKSNRQPVFNSVCNWTVSHNLVIFIRLFVISFFVEPVCKGTHCLCNIMSIPHKLWEISFSATLVQVWLVNEVPTFLISASVILNIVSPCRTLDKWVLAF